MNLGWRNEINFTVQQNPQEDDDFGMHGMMFWNCLLTVDYAVTDGFNKQFEHTVSFNGRSSNMIGAIREAFQSLLDKKLYSKDFRVFDCIPGPDRNSLPWVINYNSDMVKQVFEELFRDQTQLQEHVLMLE
jgi:hypothetical protein